MPTIELSDATYNELKSIFADKQSNASVLFDHSGRRIPTGLSNNVIDPNKDFYITQPEIDFKARLDRLKKYWPGKAEFPTVAQFKQKSNALHLTLHEDEKVKNICLGVSLPIVIPQIKITDHGTLLESLMKAVEASYKEAFPDRRFYNYRKDDLAKKVSIVEGTRFESLKIAKKTAVALCFPACLQGFSVKAQREQMNALPSGFMLGGLDTIIAMIMYPDVLARDFHTPLYDLSAYQWRDAGYSLDLGPGDVILEVDFGAFLADAYDHYAGGVSFLG